MKRLQRLISKVVLIAVMGIMLTACGSNKKASEVNLNKYITINTNGYDTQGEAVYTFDYELFKKEFGKRIQLSDDMAKYQIWQESGKDAELMFLEMCVSCNIEFCPKNEEVSDELQLIYGGIPLIELSDIMDNTDVNQTQISNGDEFRISWKCNDQFALDNFGLKLKYSDTTYTAEGLKEVEKFDPFEHIQVTFSGLEGMAEITIIEDEDYQDMMQYIVFKPNKEVELSQGEVVNVHANLTIPKADFINQFGCDLSCIEKKYTVGETNRYVQNFDEITDDVEAAMAEMDNNLFWQSANDEWSNTGIFDSGRMVEEYLFTLKDGLEDAMKNYLLRIYEVIVKDSYGNYVRFYWYDVYQNLIICVDGTGSVDVRTNRTVSHDSWLSGSYGNYLDIGDGNYVVGCVTAQDAFVEELHNYEEYYNWTHRVTEYE